MVMTAYGDINQRTAAWAATDMLDHAEPILVLSKFGMTKPIPKGKAKSAKFRRPVPFAISLTPLTEGVTPTAQQMQYQDVTVSLLQYGQVVEITDHVEDLAEDPVMSDANMLCGEQAAETKELLLWGVLKGGTNVQYAGFTGASGSRATTVTQWTDAKVSSIIRSLKAQRAKPVNQMLSGSSNYGTYPIEGGYIAFCHTDAEYDIRKLTGFVSTAQYGSRQILCPEEIGSVPGMRFIISPLLAPLPDAGGAKGLMKSTSGINADIYQSIIISKDSYFHCPLKGASAIKPTVINPGTPSKSDPLGQRGYVGWKTWDASSITNQPWLVRLEHCVTAL